MYMHMYMYSLQKRLCHLMVCQKLSVWAIFMAEKLQWCSMVFLTLFTTATRLRRTPFRVEDFQKGTLQGKGVDNLSKEVVKYG